MLFVHDIGNALNLWLSQEYPQSAEQTRIVSQNSLMLLCDLLSLKGCVQNPCDIYEMMFRFLTWMNVPLKEYITILWQSRILRHSLRTLPVSGALIMTLSKHCEFSNSMEVWVSCIVVWRDQNH